MFPVVAILIIALVAFAAGVVFHKYVISEAEAIKAHVTAEVGKVRTEVANSLKAAASKV